MMNRLCGERGEGMEKGEMIRLLFLLPVIYVRKEQEWVTLYTMSAGYIMFICL